MSSKHPSLSALWPVLSGHNTKFGSLKGWLVVIFLHTGNSFIRSTDDFGELPVILGGTEDITQSNKNAVRHRIESYFHLKATDAVVLVPLIGTFDDKVFVPFDETLYSELRVMMQKHEYAMGLMPTKIFLSHKGADKDLIRNYKRTLSEFKFDPWLDEDAMSAGTELERGIRQGFRDSCAAVFFVTPNFKDENFLASEVDYAIAEKRSKGEKFAIITLVFAKDGQRGTVPELLRRYVWKEPSSDLEALREIIRSLPITVGDVYWRQ